MRSNWLTILMVAFHMFCHKALAQAIGICTFSHHLKQHQTQFWSSSHDSLTISMPNVCLQLSIYPPRKNTRRQIKSSKTAATETNINRTFYQLIEHCGNSSLRVTRVSDHVGSQKMVKFITNRNMAALNAGNINMCSCFFENEIWCR
jgi:hypothetical protein